MKRVCEYPIHVTDEQSVMMPVHRKVLCVQVQDGTPCLWAEIDDEPEGFTSPVFVRIYGAGHPLGDDPGRYVGTFQVGPFHWHVYVGNEQCLN